MRARRDPGCFEETLDPTTRSSGSTVHVHPAGSKWLGQGPNVARGHHAALPGVHVVDARKRSSPLEQCRACTGTDGSNVIPKLRRR